MVRHGHRVGTDTPRDAAGEVMGGVEDCSRQGGQWGRRCSEQPPGSKEQPVEAGRTLQAPPLQPESMALRCLCCGHLLWYK